MTNRYEPRPGDLVTIGEGVQRAQYLVGTVSPNKQVVELTNDLGVFVLLAHTSDLTLVTSGPLPATGHVNTDRPALHTRPVRRVVLPLPLAAVLATIAFVLVVVVVFLVASAQRPQATGGDNFARTVTAAGIPADAVDAARDAARSFCDLLDTGTSFPTAYALTVQLGDSKGIDERQVEAIVRGGVPAYCPSYTADMQDGLR